MRFHLTLKFAQALKSFREAEAAVDFIPLDAGPTRDVALRAEKDLFNAVMQMPADTAEGVRHKLKLLDDRDDRGHGFYYTEMATSIDRDLCELRRPNATLAGPFLAWRAAYEAVAKLGEVDDSVADAADDVRSKAYHAFMDAPCTAPGDFIAKTYVNLLESVGGCSWRPRFRFAPNVWDIDIAQQDDVREEGEVHDRATYRDLSDCDLGCCLLTFGLLEFSAREWVVRSQEIGLPVSLIIGANGERAVSWGVGLASEDPRLGREVTRLLRLAAYPGEDRHLLIGDELEANWPQIVQRRVAVESAAA